MKRTKFNKMIAGILTIAMAAALCPVNPSAAKQRADQKMVTKSSFGDAVTKAVPEKETAKGRLSEAKAEDEPIMRPLIHPIFVSLQRDQMGRRHPAG